jgi:hypothetical protein
MANPMYGQNKFDNKLDVKGKLNKSGGIPVQDNTGVAPVGGLISPPYAVYRGGVVSSDGFDFADADPYSESATQLFPLGSTLNWGDRVFKYAQMDGAVTAGKLLQQAASIVAHHSQMSTTAIVAVSTSGTVDISVETAGDTDITLNQYQEGYLLVNDQTGAGQSWKIKSHPAHNHGDDPTIVITCYGKVSTALAAGASSQLTLTTNPYKDVIVSPTSATGGVVGVTNIDMTDDYFGWIQVRGPKACLAGETLVLGMSVMASDADAGAVMPDNGDDLEPVIGEVMASVVVDAEYNLINLKIG